jgi:hypothetical protein
VVPAAIVSPRYPARSVLPVESTDFAVRRFLALGPEIEVLGPPQLRSQVAAVIRATAALY